MAHLTFLFPFHSLYFPFNNASYSCVKPGNLSSVTFLKLLFVGLIDRLMGLTVIPHFHIPESNADVLTTVRHYCSSP